MPDATCACSSLRIIFINVRVKKRRVNVRAVGLALASHHSPLAQDPANQVNVYIHNMFDDLHAVNTSSLFSYHVGLIDYNGGPSGRILRLHLQSAISAMIGNQKSKIGNSIRMAQG